MTLHPLEGGQVAATGGPGGRCQPHTVRQLTREKEKEREGGGSGGETKETRKYKETRREVTELERNKTEESRVRV